MQTNKKSACKWENYFRSENLINFTLKYLNLIVVVWLFWTSISNVCFFYYKHFHCFPTPQYSTSVCVGYVFVFFFLSSTLILQSFLASPCVTHKHIQHSKSNIYIVRKYKKKKWTKKKKLTNKKIKKLDKKWNHSCVRILLFNFFFVCVFWME